MTPFPIRRAVLSVPALVCLTLAPALQASGGAEGATGVKAPPPPHRATPSQSPFPAVTWSPFADYRGRQLTLGPTGATGWIHENRIYVAKVAQGSPATRKLLPGDAILGANGKAFPEGGDPRMVLGAAITASETPEKKGVLTLSVLRGGERKDVAIRLRTLGAYSPTWPFDCPKSARILREACDHLVRYQYPDGHIQGELEMYTMRAGLLWLASGEVKYLDNARRAAYLLSETKYEGVTLNAWPLGYGGIFLAEYYLATGDQTVVGALKRFARLMCDGQMKCGSWGHTAPWGGYGAVNSVGLSCAIALVLTKECGLAVDEKVLQRSRAFFRRYVDRGGIPYGDHKPWRGPGGNGKDALAAVFFQLAGGDDHAVDYFARHVAGSYDYREEGHTGCYFSIQWGPLAAIHAGKARFREFLDHQRWYYDLARTYDGGLTIAPNAENLSGRTPGGYSFIGTECTTGGVGLVYALPRKKLRLLGAPPSVFGRKLSGPIAEARELYEQRKWKPLTALTAKLSADTKLSAQDRRYARQLADAAKAQRYSVKLTLDAFARQIAEGDVYRAWELLASLERLLGKDAKQLADAQAVMAKNMQWVETGRDYYKAWNTLRDYTWQYWHYYGKQAKKMMDGVGPPRPENWLDVVATSENVVQSWKSHQWGDRQADAPRADPIPAKLKDWTALAFDDAAWPTAKGPVKGGKGGWEQRNLLLRRVFELPRTIGRPLRLRLAASRECQLKVYLNGTLVLDVVKAPFRGYASIPLPPPAARLLVKGKNVLAAWAVSDNGRASVDVGLQARMR